MSDLTTFVEPDACHSKTKNTAPVSKFSRWAKSGGCIASYDSPYFYMVLLAFGALAGFRESFSNWAF